MKKATEIINHLTVFIMIVTGTYLLAVLIPKYGLIAAALSLAAMIMAGAVLTHLLRPVRYRNKRVYRRI